MVKMNDLIIEAIRNAGNWGASTHYVTKSIRPAYPKITHADALRRLKRLRDKGLIRAANDAPRRGELYVWFAVDND